MGHHEKLCKIDIPKARAQILKSISEFRRHDTLALLFEDFLKGLAGKRIDARVKEKLQNTLQEHTVLKVFRVTYQKADGVTGLPEYTFRIWMYDIEQNERSFLVRTKEDGTLDIDAAMIADRKWGAHADFLEAGLPKFAYRATKFNDMVNALQNMCEDCVAPGEHFPVYPLSTFFHWYQLHEN